MGIHYCQNPLKQSVTHSEWKRPTLIRVACNWHLFKTMNLCWRLGALIAFSAILLSNHSSLAAESCEGLFTPPMQITTLESSAVFTLLSQYYKAPTAAGKTMAEAKLKALESSIREALNERGLTFEERSFNNGTLDIHWTEFEISTKGTHPLNKAARSLNKKLGTVMVFNPLANMEYNFTASFRWMENKLMISREAVFQYFTHIDAHEVIHAHFLAQRLGKIKFLPKAPVGIHMESRTSLDGRNGLYSHFMSFEELVTYAYDVTYSAKQTLKYTSDRLITNGTLIKLRTLLAACMRLLLTPA
jgi:hypothetical protein